MSPLDIIGWIGAFCFAICGAPQALKSYKDGHSEGISWGLLILWGLGEVCMLIYVTPKLDYPLLFNYLGNILFVGTILRFKISPRKT